ncbi:unnamed protein product, partial [Brassica oleracea var. botrytis]
YNLYTRFQNYFLISPRLFVFSAVSIILSLNLFDFSVRTNVHIESYISLILSKFFLQYLSDDTGFNQLQSSIKIHRNRCSKTISYSPESHCIQLSPIRFT